MTQREKIKCPACSGKGWLIQPLTTDDKVQLAKLLRKAGCSIHAIKNTMGYKSPRSVSYLLEK